MEQELQTLNPSVSSTFTITPSLDSTQEHISLYSTGDAFSLKAATISTAYQRTEAVEDDALSDLLTNSPSRFAVKRSWWLLELLASTLALIGLVTLVTVLKLYDGQPQATWNYRALTFNGLVALLATITRAALMVPVAEAVSQEKWNCFSAANEPKRRKVQGRKLRDLDIIDGASRGAFGSVKLLWVTKGLSFTSIGAVVTILSLAFNTLSQQLVFIEYRTINSSDTDHRASVQRSEYFGHTRHATEGFVPELPMRAAISSGVLSLNQVNLPVDCPTGNCIWPIIPSLAVCGACTNVTEQIITTWDETLGSDSITTTGNYSSYQIPQGLSLLADDIRWTQFKVSLSSGVFYPKRFSDDDARFQPHIIANFAALGVSKPTLDGLITATECSLWLCVQAWQISVRAGMQNRRIIDEWSHVPPGRVRAKSRRSYDRNFTDIPSHFNVAAGAYFSFDDRAAEGAYNGLKDLQGVVKTPRSVGSAVGSSAGYNITNDFVEAIWENRDTMDHWIQQLALSMTNSIIQTDSAANNSRYASIISTSVPYIRVQWWWLIFPVAMVLASLTFLAASMWQTRTSNTRAWKSSALALLVCSVDEDIRLAATSYLDKYEGLPPHIENQRLRLKKDGNNGWAFTGV